MKIFENIWLIIVICFFLYIGFSTGAWGSIALAFLDTWFKIFILITIVGVVQLIVYFVKRGKNNAPKTEITAKQKLTFDVKTIPLNNFLKKNWFKLVVILLLLFIYLKINSALNILIDNSNYNLQNIEKIESSLDGFYSDWYRSQ